MTHLQHQGYSEWLVLRCQQGELEAFERLVDLWRGRFYLYARNRLGLREAAEDVTQECLLSISRGISKLDDPVAFPKWSFRILERRCVDYLRKTIRERETHQQQELDATFEPETAATMESELTVAQLLKMIDPRLATLLRLYYLESLSIAEIAEVINVPAGTVKSRLFYARKLLGKIIENA